MMEWSDKNRFSSFNSLKGLAFYERYKNIVAWLDGKAQLGPPVECNLDPVAECNLRCPWCITQRYLRHHREEVGEMRILPTDYIFRLIDFLAEWGVKGLCLSGGGEPTLHKDLWRFIPYAREKGMDIAVVTNATNISDRLSESLMLCRWVALSVDLADRETYRAVKGADKFDQVIANIAHLATLREKTKSSVDLCFKVLVLPENVDSIYKACKLAKDLGVQDFHVRPCDFERHDIEGHQKLSLPISVIREEFARCHKEETDNFRVFTIVHKFDEGFHNMQPFKRCLATPLLLPVLTDGNGYLCVDVKMMKEYRLGSAYPHPEEILEWWGGERHRQMIKNILPKIHCADRRCTFGQYNAQIEEVVLNDGMCLAFP
jgi:MoaA/NifB/PqqE/SkfB family radical SAM enzyme